MNHITTLTVPEESAGERLDSFLAQQLPEYSRSFWQKQCDAGKVTLAGAPLKASKKLVAGEEVNIELPPQQGLIVCDLPVVYEDDDVVVINKPAGILTHAKGEQNYECTVGEFMRGHTTDGLDTNRPGIVHRLDRGTSGLIIAAKHNEAKRWLQKQFAERKVKKTYLALIAGEPKQPRAIIDAPLERNPAKPQSFRTSASGKPAQTEYLIAESLPGYTLLQLHPKTGRTHQLRVHLQYINRPIVGDELYGKSQPGLSRIFLHAAELELTLPSRERKVFLAPLPPELEAYLIKLRTKPV